MSATSTHSGAAHFDRLVLEAGVLAPLTVAYETYGRLNDAGTNAVLVCHALTGSAHAGALLDDDGKRLGAEGWWEPLIGPDRALDTNRFFVVCANILGSCYGSSGPTSSDPTTGQPYGPDFPSVTIRDMVRAQRLLVERLGIRRLACVTGGSLGGFQVLEWAALFPDLVASIIPIATATAHSAWCIGFNEVARTAIRLDPAFRDGRYPPDQPPALGLGLARQMAMISYRSDLSFARRFGRQLTGEGSLSLDDGESAADHAGSSPADGDAAALNHHEPLPSGGHFEVSRYLRYQGQKLVNRFDANSYIAITEAMDRHDLARGRGSVADALRSFTGPVLCMGIDSDILYPVHEQLAMATLFKDLGNPTGYAEITSLHGHDAFLIEWEQMDKAMRPFLGRLG